MKLFKLMQTSFDQFDNTIRIYLSKALNNLGLQYTHSQIFGVIFDGIKGVFQNIMFYIEDALNEQNIFRASRRSSVYSLAKISGYEAYYGSAGIGLVNGTIKIANTFSVNGNKIYIQNNTRIINRKTNMVYVISLPNEYYVFDISKPIITHQFKIIQGFYEKSTYVAKGYNLETIHISSIELFDKNYINVYVNGEKWTQVASLYDMTENGKEYIISNGYDNSFDVMFGNDIYGTKLSEGQTVNVEYLKHNGILGNILSDTETNFVFLDMGTTVSGEYIDINNYMKLKLFNCISGGTNSDTIEFIKTNIGYNSRSLVLASEDNFKLFFKRFSFVGYVNCWSEDNSMIITATCLQNMRTTIKSFEDYENKNPNDLLLTSEQKLMIENTLNNSKRAFAGITLNFRDPIIRKYSIICYVTADNTYNKSIISNSIKQTLMNYFLNLPDGTQFIAKSTLINNIMKNNSN